MELKIDYKKLIEIAAKSLEFSYSPYSHFKVGSALLCGSGKIYTGCNVECNSFSLTICAERNSFSKAISEGEKEFIAIAIVTGRRQIDSPCGACRHFMMEFSQDLEVILAESTEVYEIYQLKDLLPKHFIL